MILHDRQSVHALHQAYADKIESFFLGLKRAPGDPCEVRIRAFGSARTFIARGHDWLNRATLVGDESFDQLDEIISYFAQHGQRCHIEWNAGNCYRPDTWNDELGRRLLERELRPGGFRCVWVNETHDVGPAEPTPVTLRHFGPSELDDFLEILAVIERHSDEQKAQSRLNIVYGEGDEHWHHYVGYIDGAPACSATLFTGRNIAYLEWGHTLSEFRRRGCHRALIRQRLADARAAGCDLAFSVTDVGTQSARNLQRLGFRLAYNYIMLVREPLPIG
jgi:GNAT superfamily N-acetyltransferase